MKEYVVCRTYCTRMRWKVKAKSKEAALKMLDETTHDHMDKLPWDLGDEEWLGPVGGYIGDEVLEDNVLEVEK